MNWRVADVTDLAAVDPSGRLAGTATLLLDNGCLHGISGQRLPGWAHTVNTLATLHCVLLVHAAPRRRHRIGPDGTGPPQITELLGPGWHQDPSPEPGWYHYTRVDQPPRTGLPASPTPPAAARAPALPKAAIWMAPDGIDARTRG